MTGLLDTLVWYQLRCVEVFNKDLVDEILFQEPQIALELFEWAGFHFSDVEYERTCNHRRSGLFRDVGRQHQFVAI